MELLRRNNKHKQRSLYTNVSNLPSPSEIECYLLLPDRPLPGLKWCSEGNKRCCRWHGGLSALWMHRNKILHLLHWWSPLWNQSCLKQTERVWHIMKKYINCNARKSVHLNPWTWCTGVFSVKRIQWCGFKRQTCCRIHEQSKCWIATSYA